MDPIEIAKQLIASAADAESNELSSKEFPYFYTPDEVLSNERMAQKRHELQALIDELSKALAQADWNPDRSEKPDENLNLWSFGVAATIRGSAREVLRGFLVPQYKAPIVSRVPENVALFLITIDNSKDYLKRETHGMGWHYHYLNWRKKRSNVILSWDTRWTKPPPQTRPPERRGLFVEPHSAKNAKFQAKHWLWGKEKKESIYDACKADLCNWPIQVFKCAADDSEIVYPLGQALTPHALKKAVNVQKTAVNSKKNKKSRRRN